MLRVETDADAGVGNEVVGAANDRDGDGVLRTGMIPSKAASSTFVSAMNVLTSSGPNVTA